MLVCGFAPPHQVGNIALSLPPPPLLSAAWQHDETRHHTADAGMPVPTWLKRILFRERQAHEKEGGDNRPAYIRGPFGTGGPAGQRSGERESLKAEDKEVTTQGEKREPLTADSTLIQKITNWQFRNEDLLLTIPIGLAVWLGTATTFGPVRGLLVFIFQ